MNTYTRVMFYMAVALIATFFAAAAILGSSSKTKAMLHGMVTEPSGAAVPGALVPVSSGDFIHSVSTDATGQYVVAGPAPGHYRLRLRSAGIPPFQRHRLG